MLVDMTQKTIGKTVRVKDLSTLARARAALKELLRVDVSESVTVDAGLCALEEKLSGLSLPAERVRPLILKCQVSALQRFQADLSALGYPVDDLKIGLDERAGAIVIEHDGKKIHYETGDPVGMNLIN